MSIADVIANRKPRHVECGDALAVAKTLPSNCLNCIATSPPYYGLRDYGVDGQIGLEETPDAYAAKLVAVFAELRRALHPTGTLWLNLGDSYARMQENNVPQSKNPLCRPPAGTGRVKNAGLKAKDLIGVPWLVAFALRADGWYLRQWMPWAVRNKMPESADDRPSTACETVFLLSRESDYFFDMEAVKRPAAPESAERYKYDFGGAKAKQLTEEEANGPGSRTHPIGEKETDGNRNFRSADLWFDSVGMLLAGHLDGTDDDTILGLDVPTQSYRGSHFAVWPQRLVANFIAAGTSERGVCPHCFAPYVRIVKKERVPTRPGGDSKVLDADNLKLPAEEPGRTRGAARFEKSTLVQVVGNRDPERHVTRTETVGWVPSCSCPEHEPIPSLVFDPFTGSGTTGKVALDMNRRFLGSELNKDYFKLIEKRMRQAKSSLF